MYFYMSGKIETISKNMEVNKVVNYLHTEDNKKKMSYFDVTNFGIIKKFKNKGVDEIYFVSVNDPFVMNAWMMSYPNSKINYIADSNSELLNSSGLEMDLSVIGLGKRLSRFAMLIDNGLIKMIFDEKGGGLEKSKAENVLENL